MKHAVIFGAGPAGLATAYELEKGRVSSTILEKENAVGGSARTVNFKGFLFDLDPDSQTFLCPLPPNAAGKLGLIERFRCGLSHLRARIAPKLPENDFATWATNRFGARLFRNLLENYTEKVWSMPCDRIGAEWAGQCVHPPDAQKSPAMIWERMAQELAYRGSRVLLHSPVEKVFWEPGSGVTGVMAGGRYYTGTHYISTLPTRSLLQALDPAPPAYVLHAASRLRYRDFLSVVLMVRPRDPLPCTCIHIHDRRVRLARVRKYTNQSPEMSPDPSVSCLGLEYFCAEGDDLWTAPGQGLIALGRRELAETGLASNHEFIDGTVVRVAKAYPVCDAASRQALDTVRRFLPSLPNLQLAGRNSQHRHDSQHRSVRTGVLAARNILGANFDLWDLNTDRFCPEESVPTNSGELAAIDAGQPLAPRRV